MVRGTLFPLSSKKIARAINAASNNRPVVMLANLSGFDGSPESMRRLQLEYGAEIGRAIVNFKGPMVFCVISRYHGGAYVVFSRAFNEQLEVPHWKGPMPPSSAALRRRRWSSPEKSKPHAQRPAPSGAEPGHAQAEVQKRGRLRSQWEKSTKWSTPKNSVRWPQGLTGYTAYNGRSQSVHLIALSRLTSCGLT